MFIINKSKNEALSLERKTFQELGFKERKNLQEWICKNTELIGERLLIIQKEFSGFDETNERLDLLAIDEAGDIVVIENKLDDTGRDVIWQALKYVSYCSSLSKGDIKEIYQKYLDIQNISEGADQLLSDFLGIEEFAEAEINTGDQRVILVAASFRKEVTSTVMWLLNHNIRIKCIKVTPYVLEDNILLDTEQIIPVKDAEEYLIKIAHKKQEELINKEKSQNRYIVRLKFWDKLLKAMNEKSDLYKNVSPTKDNYLSCGSGHGGVAYGLAITGKFVKLELYINKGLREENKKIFDSILECKEEIESKFGNKFDWQRADEGKGSRIAYYLHDVNYFNEDDWDEIIKFLTDNMVKFEYSIKNVLDVVLSK